MNAFHAYDIRGIYNEDFNKEDVYKIGFYLPEILNAKKILVGRDIRESSREIFDNLCNGLIDAGVSVYNAGLTTTPMIYWATARFQFDASVMITASHNDREYNGLKVSKKEALPVGFDSGLDLVQRKMLSKEAITPANYKIPIQSINFMHEYLHFQRNYLGDISSLKIAVDCSNGMAGIVIKELLGKNPFYINENPDGAFPGHSPNPLVAKNILQLQSCVKENNCDLGVIFDGDADRVMFVDENGTFISPDLMIALLGHYFLDEKKQKGLVLQDIRSSKAIGEYLQPMGGIMHTWRVGRAYAAMKLREIDGIYGGELAGHYYFRDFYYSDSGIMAALIILSLFNKFKNQGQSVSEVISKIRKYANSGEINFRIENKKAAMDAVLNYFTSQNEPTANFDFDGYRIEYPDWWFNIRPSNTEPYLRLLVEASSTQLLNEKVQEIKNILKKFS